MFLPALIASKYVLLFVAAIIEGPIIMMASGFLFHLGQLDFAPMYIALVAGDFVADLSWYWVGYYGARHLVVKWGKYLDITQGMIDKMERLFNKFHLRILFLSKMTLGFGTGTGTLLVAGILKVPFGRYALVNFLGGFVWTLLLIIIGYFFGNVYSLVPSDAKVVYVIVLAATLVVAFRAFNNYVRTHEW